MRQHDQKPPGGPKERVTIIQISVVIYRYKCDRVQCDKEYTREYARTFGGTLKEHLRLLPH